MSWMHYLPAPFLQAVSGMPPHLRRQITELRFRLEKPFSVTAEGRNLFPDKEGRLTENSPENMALIAANIRNYCKDVKVVLVSSDLETEQTERNGAELQRALPDIRFESYGSLLRDPEALRKLPVCDGVLLVLVCGKSRYSQVKKSLERVTDAGKTVLGCVVVEA